VRFYRASVTQRLLLPPAPAPQECEYGAALPSLKSSHPALVSQGRGARGCRGAAEPASNRPLGTVSAAVLSSARPQPPHRLLSPGPCTGLEGEDLKEHQVPNLVLYAYYEGCNYPPRRLLGEAVPSQHFTARPTTPKAGSNLRGAKGGRREANSQPTRELSTPRPHSLLPQAQLRTFKGTHQATAEGLQRLGPVLSNFPGLQKLVPEQSRRRTELTEAAGPRSQCLLEILLLKVLASGSALFKSTLEQERGKLM